MQNANRGLSRDHQLSENPETFNPPLRQNGDFRSKAPAEFHPAVSDMISPCDIGQHHHEQNDDPLDRLNGPDATTGLAVNDDGCRQAIMHSSGVEWGNCLTIRIKHTGLETGPVRRFSDQHRTG